MGHFMSRTGVPASVRRHRQSAAAAEAFPIPVQSKPPINDNKDRPPALPPVQGEGEKRFFWQSFSGALGADLREPSVIAGASGLQHPCQAVAVDDKNNRL